MYIALIGPEFPDPPRPLVAGDVCTVVEPFSTLGREHYAVGDQLHIVGRTDKAPHGRRASTGNLLVRGKDGKVSVWSNIEYALSRGTLRLEGVEA